MYKVRTETVGQFTGLNDDTFWNDLSVETRTAWLKSGKTKRDWKGLEIFEGDILTWESITRDDSFDTDFSLHEVYFSRGMFLLDNIEVGGKPLFDIIEGNSLLTTIKVTGNIHDEEEGFEDEFGCKIESLFDDYEDDEDESWI